MQRRSLHLRALGARPQTIAAQMLLAEHLPGGDPEGVTFMRIFRPLAAELHIS